MTVPIVRRVLQGSRKIRRRLENSHKRFSGKPVVHVLHVSKTGGTAIRRALKPHSVTQSHIINIHNAKTYLKDVPEGQLVCFFLRDPIDRFVSGFCARRRQGVPGKRRAWTDGEARAFEYFNTPNELAQSLSSSERDVRKRALDAMREIAHVREPIWKWFESEEYIRHRSSDIYFVGCQENLERDFESLKTQLNVPDTATLPRDTAAARRNPGGCATDLSEVATENLRSWYRNDYEFLALFEEGERGLRLRRRD